MDHLSLNFAEESALRQVENCSDLDELKAVTRSLLKSHFCARALICDLMLQNLRDLNVNSHQR